MRALVISGGASKGAFAGGILEHLIKERGKDYDLLVGTSTGALIVPFAAIGKIDKLKRIFTSITQEDIFNVSPFTIRKKHGLFISKMNHVGMVRQIIAGKKTFGESKNLRKLIGKNLTLKNFDAIKNSGKEVLVTVANLTAKRVQYKSILDNDYTDFCDWMWASSNIVPFMSLVKKNGQEYADGSFGEYIPIQHAINKGATKIDVIILNPKDHNINTLPSRNAFDVLTKTFDFMLSQIEKDDIAIGNLEGLNRKVKIKFYHTPRLLTDNAFIFRPEKMKRWWEEGLQFARKNTPDQFTLKPE
ncbi:MAG: putative patatin/cPLA2 family phospholipase [Granulosicoccus sp.]|jgi:predicted patatin/cPLA2 family phospholipase